MRTFVLGTRGSALALAQSETVRLALEAAHPRIRIQESIVKTRGDRRLDLRLQSTGPLSKGLFTKELEAALLARKIDFAVHSLKDLPGERAPGLRLGAILPRENPADLVISKTPLEALPPNAVFATSSPRRARQLTELYPGFQVVDIRGNVPTRLQKLIDSENLDGVLLAYAGLRRLDFLGSNLRWKSAGDAFSGLAVTRLSKMLPAPGQGAVAVEIRKVDQSLLRLLRAIHCERTALCVEIERQLLQRLGGGCHLALGARARIGRSGEGRLDAVFFSDEGEVFRGGTRFDPSEDPASPVERLAAKWKI